MKVNYGKMAGAIIAFVGALALNVWIVLAGLAIAIFIEIEGEW